MFVIVINHNVIITDLMQGVDQYKLSINDSRYHLSIPNEHYVELVNLFYNDYNVVEYLLNDIKSNYLSKLKEIKISRIYLILKSFCFISHVLGSDLIDEVSTLLDKLLLHGRNYTLRFQEVTLISKWFSLLEYKFIELTNDGLEVTIDEDQLKKCIDSIIYPQA